ncbi:MULTISPECIES: hypothetical protein [Brevibacillus]|uniref:DUF4362 domain-containing protein n=3 Tax=Brevibacillus TaxID=55080 RepID=A0AA48M8G7_9BACL|nr:MULTISPECIES: hypothetical protein [Brevibacillus]NNV03508.1 hypothetical protein [Brevibacillus sp. MCWH]REK61512.1 MAG: hypothetical protein DF221_16440 [Brevibacillus sp.]CAJ1003193.1 DUF4362 domain-containing protein [Brevibacillus aydinogluensis]
MKRKLFFPIGLIVMALIVAGIFYFFIEKNKRYSFSEIVSIHEGDIAAVLVDSDSTTEFIRDQREIKKFMASFSKVEVSKFDEDLPFDKSCKISLINDTTVLYLIFLYDNGTIEIYDRAKRKLNQYKIRNNDFNYEEMVKRKTACGATCKQQLLAAAELS